MARDREFLTFLQNVEDILDIKYMVGLGNGIYEKYDELKKEIDLYISKHKPINKESKWKQLKLPFQS